MSRMIDADALEELFREVIGGIAKKPEMNGNLEHMVRASAMVIEMIQDAPTIEPRCEACEAFNKTRLLIPQTQRKKGKWIPQNLNKSDGMISTAVYYYPKCSVCGASANYTNFCPNCGAEMTEESEEPKRCDTCKHERSRWFSRCADCSDYELWEGKDETGRSTTEN